MQVWLFGNPDYEPDALPLKLLPELKKRLPGVSFVLKDPNEEWDLERRPTQTDTQTNAEEPLIIIDTVQGIKEVTVFNDLNQFQSTPRVTVHDFDLGMKLRWLQKLKKLPSFKIIGIPSSMPQEQIANNVLQELRKLS